MRPLGEPLRTVEFGCVGKTVQSSRSRPRLNEFVAQISPPHPHSMYVKRCYAGLLHDTPIAVSWIQNSYSSYCLDISHFHLFVDTTGPQPSETPFRLDDHCHLSYTVVHGSSRMPSEKSFVFGPDKQRHLLRNKRYVDKAPPATAKVLVPPPEKKSPDLPSPSSDVTR